MELKPCPLCGTKAGYDKSYRISCNGCGLSVEKWADNRTSSNKEEVKELWNSRPQNQKLLEALEEIADLEVTDPIPAEIAQQVLDDTDSSRNNL